MSWQAKEIADLRNRIAELERIIDNMFRMGKVEEVDPDKGTARLKIGKDPDGNDQLSPWRPYAQMAGALKVHAPPSKGQNMLLISPAGDTSQGVAIPMSWNNGNENPGKTKEANVITFGDARISLKGDALEVKVPRIFFECGGTTFELTAGGLKAVADDYDWQ